MSHVCVATIFIFLPWPKSQISMCTSGTYGEKRNDLLDEKPTISELCEHIHISGSSITIGIILISWMLRSSIIFTNYIYKRT